MYPTTIYIRLSCSSQQVLHFLCKTYFISIYRMAYKCPYSGKKWLKKKVFYVHLNWTHVHYQNLIRRNLWMRKSFGYCFEILAMIVFLYTVQKIKENSIYHIHLIKFLFATYFWSFIQPDMIYINNMRVILSLFMNKL